MLNDYNYAYFTVQVVVDDADREIAARLALSVLLFTNLSQ